jgi:hypothetical protein
MLTVSEVTMLKDLIKLADHLDLMGEEDEASLIDEILPHLDKINEDAEYKTEKNVYCQRSFTNEIGNEIDISVDLIENKESSPRDPDMMPAVFPSVMVRISGPNSSSENMLTKVEAEKLCECLSEALDKASSEVLKTASASKYNYMLQTQLSSISEKANIILDILKKGMPLEDWMETYVAQADLMMDNIFDKITLGEVQVHPCGCKGICNCA